MFRSLKLALATGALVGWLFCSHSYAFDVLGTGTDALLGGDLTDPDDNGDPENDDGYDAIFDSSDEPGFGGGEFAFNVFDNRLGPSNDKWCCGVGGGISEDDPIWVSAQLDVPYFLTHFTVSSANDVPGRDPTHWAIQGSNDGQNYTDIYVYDDFSPWDERLQVIQWTAGDDFPAQTTSYDHFRMATYNTDTNPSGAYFQIGEIEFFGTPDGDVPPIFIGGENTIGERTYGSDQSNNVFGEVADGVSGFSARIVTAEDHGLGQLDNHTIAEEALDEAEGTKGINAYRFADFGGGGGTFGETQPYPNGVADTSQSDFAVQVTANVKIPAGEYTLGFGSDDGGQLTIAGVEFTLDGLSNDAFEDDQIRFEGNRGHNWTTGSFSLDAPLETTLVASMHERGGGDSFEIAITEGDVLDEAPNANDWELLADGVLDWEITTSAAPLLSADLSAEANFPEGRVVQFDVNGDTGESDQLAIDNPNPDVYTTILTLGDGSAFEINATGNVSSGEGFTIINADVINGTPTITSTVAGQNWVFDAATGRVCLDFCTGGGGDVAGDYNGNGMRDTGDLDLQAAAIAANDPAFDLNGDGSTNLADREMWVNELANTYMGDSNFDGQFNSSDFVTVFGAAKYESGQAATWGEGDWNGDGLFNSTDFVAAFSGGGYEKGERAGGLQTVPEPSSFALILFGMIGLSRIVRRK